MEKAFGVKSVIAVAAVSTAVGLGLGLAAGRTVLAPPPVVVERIKAVEGPVSPQVPTKPEARLPEEGTTSVTQTRKVVVPPTTARVPSQSDFLLAQERELVDTARSALLHNSFEGALVALRAHADRFADGRLAEERESLWVQALVLAGDVEQARTRAQHFHARFPQSLLGPVVDAALPP